MGQEPRRARAPRLPTRTRRGFELAQARLAITTAIASTYADLALLYAQRDSLESALAIRSETLKLVSQRVAIGLDTRAELKQAAARVPQARADLAATDEAIALTRNALAALIGAGPDRGACDRAARRSPRSMRRACRPTPRSTSSAAAPTSPPHAPGSRPRRSRIKEATAAFYPNINLTALIGLQAFGLDNLFTRAPALAASARRSALPIFHGGALSGQYRGRPRPV